MRTFEFGQGLAARSAGFGEAVLQEKRQKLEDGVAAQTAGQGEVDRDRLCAAIEFEQYSALFLQPRDVAEAFHVVQNADRHRAFEAVQQNIDKPLVRSTGNDL